MNIIRENLARYVYSGSSRRRSSSALCRRDSSGTGAVAVRDVTARSRLVCRFDGESRGGDERCSRSSSDEDDESSYAGTGVRAGAVAPEPTPTVAATKRQTEGGNAR